MVLSEAFFSVRLYNLPCRNHKLCASNVFVCVLKFGIDITKCIIDLLTVDKGGEYMEKHQPIGNIICEAIIVKVHE